MKNRNLIIFAAASMALLLGQAWLSTRFAPPEPPKQAAPAPTPAQAAPQPAAQPVPAAPAPAVAAPEAGATREVSLGKLRLTFRLRDGAILQTRWLQDDTHFFPELNIADGQDAFPGIGGSTGAPFETFKEEKETRNGQEFALVHFGNGQGDLLTYRIPDRGHVLEVALESKTGAGLGLIRRVGALRKTVDPKSGKEVELDPVARLGRVISLHDKNTEAVGWTEVMRDPFFSFLGAKRKSLPAPAPRMGLDAGLDPKSKSQQTHYFAALWEIAQPVQLGDWGYLAAPVQGQVKARLYLGPKEEGSLKAFGPAFVDVLDWGFFGYVAKALFLFLKAIHAVFPNWGWAILLFTLLIRLALWPFNTKTTIQSLRAKDLEPHQKELQAKYAKFGNDMTKKAEMQKELMAFYKKNGHNPMGGCLPMLLQLPIFFALWSMLNAVYDLRHAPWIFWIKDLSSHDPMYVLPILLGISMLAQQIATPAMGDPTQRKMMMYLMPAMMTFMFWTFPAGLNLYYLVFNLVGLLQTWWVKRSYVPQPVQI
jgi:YidC/Oxa1 family membrane protein insertase